MYKISHYNGPMFKIGLFVAQKWTWAEIYVFSKYWTFDGAWRKYSCCRDSGLKLEMCSAVCIQRQEHVRPCSKP